MTIMQIYAAGCAGFALLFLWAAIIGDAKEVRKMSMQGVVYATIFWPFALPYLLFRMIARRVAR